MNCWLAPPCISHFGGSDSFCSFCVGSECYINGKSRGVYRVIITWHVVIGLRGEEEAPPT